MVVVVVVRGVGVAALAVLKAVIGAADVVAWVIADVTRQTARAVVSMFLLGLWPHTPGLCVAVVHQRICSHAKVQLVFGLVAV